MTEAPMIAGPPDRADQFAAMMMKEANAELPAWLDRAREALTNAGNSRNRAAAGIALLINDMRREGVLSEPRPWELFGALLMQVIDADPAEATAIAVEAGVKPAAYIKAYAEANPPDDPAEDGKVAAILYEFGVMPVTYDADEWDQAREEDTVPQLVDHDTSDMETNTLIVTNVDAGVITPYDAWKDDA